MSLMRIGPAYAWDSPPGVGARVTLNSGGPEMLVVDTSPLAMMGEVLDDGAIVVRSIEVAPNDRVCAWRIAGELHELTLDWRMLRPA